MVSIVVLYYARREILLNKKMIYKYRVSFNMIYTMKTGRIYKIHNDDETIIYVGSTMQKIKDRWWGHKTSYRRWVGGNKKCSISIFPYFEEHGIEKFKIILIKEYQVIDKKHLRAYEQLWMGKLKCVNKQTSFSIEPVARKVRLEYEKKYNFEHKEKHNQQMRDHYKNNKEQYRIRACLAN